MRPPLAAAARRGHTYAFLVSTHDLNEPYLARIASLVPSPLVWGWEASRDFTPFGCGCIEPAPSVLPRVYDGGAAGGCAVMGDARASSMDMLEPLASPVGMSMCSSVFRAAALAAPRGRGDRGLRAELMMATAAALPPPPACVNGTVPCLLPSGGALLRWLPWPPFDPVVLAKLRADSLRRDDAPARAPPPAPAVAARGAVAAAVLEAAPALAAVVADPTPDASRDMRALMCDGLRGRE